MKAVIQADVRACDPPSLAVRVDKHTVAIAGPHALGQLSRVDTIARETRQVGGGPEQVSLVAVHGVPAADPAPPVVIHNLSMKQEPIAWVTVGPTQWEVRQEHIHTEWPPPARSDASDPDLAAWLLEQIAEDERRASSTILPGRPSGWQVDPEPWVTNGVGIVDDDGHSVAVTLGDRVAKHVVTWAPKRALAECDAKRQRVGFLAEQLREWREGRHDSIDREIAIDGLMMMLKLESSPYAHRQGYREEWRP